MKTPKPMMPGPVAPGPLQPGGGMAAGAPQQVQMSQPKGPAGKGFLINHNAFTDARPPAARGMKKSTGYPSFPQKVK